MLFATAFESFGYGNQFSRFFDCINILGSSKFFLWSFQNYGSKFAELQIQHVLTLFIVLVFNDFMLSWRFKFKMSL